MPRVAEIFLNNFVNKFLDNKKHSKNIIYYYKYVDDIILLWARTKRQLETFLKFLNYIHERIKFTVEKEKEKNSKFSRFEN